MYGRIILVKNCILIHVNVTLSKVKDTPGTSIAFSSLINLTLKWNYHETQTLKDPT